MPTVQQQYTDSKTSLGVIRTDESPRRKLIIRIILKDYTVSYLVIVLLGGSVSHRDHAKNNANSAH